MTGLRHWGKDSWGTEGQETQGKETDLFTVTGVGTVRHWGKTEDRLRIQDLFRTARGAVKT